MYPDGQLLDVGGPTEVFALANRQAHEDGGGDDALYDVRLVAMQRGPVAMSSGVRFVADLACAELGDRVDTLLISGGNAVALERARADRALVAWIAAMAPRVRRIGSICSGALLLAEAGVLDGRTATTHWLDVPELVRRYPAVRVQPDAIYTRDGSVWTSAGITAGMDLALAMLAEDHGMALALKVAKRMVMVTKRSGGQSQFSRQLQEQSAPDAFAELIAWMRANLRRRLDVEQLAQRVHMSSRHFRRRFQAAFRATPQKYVDELRIEAAKAQLEHTRKELKRIAVECGFASEEAMRRAFVRRIGVRPREYRERFSPA